MLADKRGGKLEIWCKGRKKNMYGKFSKTQPRVAFLLRLLVNDAKIIKPMLYNTCERLKNQVKSNKEYLVCTESKF